MEKRFRKNEQIRGVSRVMLVGSVGADGKPEILSFDAALQRAYDQELDLVEIGPKQDPPVVKVMDFGSFLYHEAKRASENSRKNRDLELKEMRFRPVTDEADFHTKLRQIAAFLEKGHKVKVAIRFKGREITHSQAGFEMVNRLIGELGDTVSPEAPPRMEGRQLIGLLAPGKKFKIAPKPQAKDESAEVPRVATAQAA